MKPTGSIGENSSTRIGLGLPLGMVWVVSDLQSDRCRWKKRKAVRQMVTVSKQTALKARDPSICSMRWLMISWHQYKNWPEFAFLAKSAKP
jgi:hypothetical protein